MGTAVNFRWHEAVDGLSRVLWPPRCVVCMDPGHAGRDLCRACFDVLPWLGRACRLCALPLPAGHTDALCGACLQQPPPLAACHAAFLYAMPLDRLLPRLKFHDDLAVAHVLSALMVEAFTDLPRPDAVVPVPLHHARLRRRGYDQALELARPLARSLGLPFRRDLLRRVRQTGAQSRLDKRHRRRNLAGAFVAEALQALPRHVVLVDDVMTTGATLHAAAAALHLAGVERVDAWVCARVP